MTNRFERLFALEAVEDVTVITCLRELYIGEGDQEMLRECLAHVIDSGRRKLVLDLGRVEDWNSPGFESKFYSANVRLRRLGGKLILCSVSAMKREMFAITKMDRYLEFAADRASALLALRNEPAGALGDGEEAKP